MKLANLKKFKKNLKKTNEEIADATGFSRNSVQRYFSGETDPPTDFLQKLQEVYNLNLDWLFSGEGTIFRVDYNPEKSPAETVMESGSRYSVWLKTLVASYPKLNDSDRQAIDDYIKSFFQDP